MDGPPSDDICSICRGEFHLPFRLNCSHWLCDFNSKLRWFNDASVSGRNVSGHCFHFLWKNEPSLHPCKCPMCRGLITRLTPPDTVLQESDQVLDIILRYNRLFSGEPSNLLQKLRDLPFLIRRLPRAVRHSQRLLPLCSRVKISFAMMLAAIYILSPIDFLPEEAYGFAGLLDDLLVVLVFFMLIVIMFSLILFRHGGP